MLLDVEPGPGEREGELWRAIAKLESRRISVGEAYRSIHLWYSLVLIRAGRARVWLAEVAILAAIAVFAWLTQPLFVLAGLVVLVVEAIYIEMNIEEWVAQYNDRLDSEIRRLLASAAEEG